MPRAPPLSEFSGSAPDLYWKELLEVVQFYIYRLSRLLFVRLSRVCLFVSVFHFFFRDSFFCCFLIVRHCCFSEGRKHDSGMLGDFGLLHHLQLHATSPWKRPMWILGIWHILQGCNFKGRPKMLFWHQRCKHSTPLWVTVELLWRGHSKLFKFIDYNKNLKIGLSRVVNVSCLRLTKKCTDMSLWQHYIRFFFFLSGAFKITRVLYLNVFRNIFTLKSQKSISLRIRV